MELTIRVANPAGNITIFVLDPVEQKDYVTIANKLLEIPQFEAEQVGYITAPYEGGQGRMEMMGGEFCGNATRSFGYYLSALDETHPNIVTVEVSGSKDLLDVEVEYHKHSCRTKMPLPQDVTTLTLEDGSVYSMVRFDGIYHIILPCPPKDDAFIQNLLQKVRSQYPCDAYGMMFLEEDKMTPLVWVEATNSLIWEGSCGSGSVGCGVYLSQGKPDGVYSYELRQPRGTLEVEVTIVNGSITQCKMGGEVTLSEEIKVTI